LTDGERAQVETAMRTGGGPRAVGPWLLWAALHHPLPLAPRAGNTGPECRPGTTAAGVVLDLCAGSGAWSAPYVEAGYEVVRVTLPDADVMDYQPPDCVHGVLAAPPCTEFSLAKNGNPRDLLKGLCPVIACLRIIATAGPRWWALENPTGLLGHFLGTPRDTFNPCDFGDPWTKRTALWGDFTIPRRCYVEPKSGMPGSNADERAITPPGFARAFFEANP
jgi:hypothetical protein